jgi:hypothetical protein
MYKTTAIVSSPREKRKQMLGRAITIPLNFILFERCPMKNSPYALFADHFRPSPANLLRSFFMNSVGYSMQKVRKASEKERTARTEKYRKREGRRAPSNTANALSTYTRGFSLSLKKRLKIWNLRLLNNTLLKQSDKKKWVLMDSNHRHPH